jgi:hypothetical protein
VYRKFEAHRGTIEYLGRCLPPPPREQMGIAKIHEQAQEFSHAVQDSSAYPQARRIAERYALAARRLMAGQSAYLPMFPQGCGAAPQPRPM